MKLSEAANSFGRLSEVHGLPSLQDLPDRVQSEAERSPAESLVTVAIPNEVRGA